MNRSLFTLWMILFLTGGCTKDKYYSFSDEERELFNCKKGDIIQLTTADRKVFTDTIISVEQTYSENGGISEYLGFTEFEERINIITNERQPRLGLLYINANKFTNGDVDLYYRFSIPALGVDEIEFGYQGDLKTKKDYLPNTNWYYFRQIEDTTIDGTFIRNYLNFITLHRKNSI